MKTASETQDPHNSIAKNQDKRLVYALKKI